MWSVDVLFDFCIPVLLVSALLCGLGGSCWLSMQDFRVTNLDLKLQDRIPRVFLPEESCLHYLNAWGEPGLFIIKS